MILAIVQDNIVVNVVKVHADYSPVSGEIIDDKKTRACIGFTYDPERDAFVPPKPFESWVLNEDTCLWEAPLPYPDDAGSYSWNEDLLAWELIPSE